jgi:hypothetical protein
MNENRKNIIKQILFIIFVAITIIISFFAVRTTFRLDSFLPLYFDYISLRIGYVICLLFALFAIFTSIKKFRKVHKKIYLTPLLIIGFGLIGIITALIRNSHLDDSSVIMVAQQKGEIAGNIYMEFKEDGTYKLDYYNFLYGSRYRGKYKIVNDTLALDNEHPIDENRSYMAGKLLIRGDSLFFQLNKDNSYNESPFMKIEIIKNDSTNVH